MDLTIFTCDFIDFLIKLLAFKNYFIVLPWVNDGPSPSLNHHPNHYLYHCLYYYVFYVLWVYVCVCHCVNTIIIIRFFWRLCGWRYIFTLSSIEYCFVFIWLYFAFGILAKYPYHKIFTFFFKYRMKFLLPLLQWKVYTAYSMWWIRPKLQNCLNRMLRNHPIIWQTKVFDRL